MVAPVMTQEEGGKPSRAKKLISRHPRKMKEGRMETATIIK
jgi:hypothetical protein